MYSLNQIEGSIKTKNMKVKGSAIRSISAFVKEKYPDRYQEWLDSLPKESKFIFEEAILATNWYPSIEAAIIPTTQIGRMFFPTTKSGAWAAGRYSAESALTGIYKVFVKMSSPFFVIGRISKIFAAYYADSEIGVVTKTDKSVIVRITRFDPPNAVLEYRIGGWMEAALELSGCKNVKSLIPVSLARGGAYTDFKYSWD